MFLYKLFQIFRKGIFIDIDADKWRESKFINIDFFRKDILVRRIKVLFRKVKVMIFGLHYFAFNYKFLAIFLYVLSSIAVISYLLVVFDSSKMNYNLEQSLNSLDLYKLDADRVEVSFDVRYLILFKSDGTVEKLPLTIENLASLGMSQQRLSNMVQLLLLQNSRLQFMLKSGSLIQICFVLETMVLMSWFLSR